MDQIKGVEVTTARSPSRQILHIDGETFAVYDAGHILVTGSGNRKVAAYAPGSWVSVKVVMGE